MSIGKNLGKFKQWTSEKIGGAEKTDTSDDFKQLEVETEQRRDSLEKLESTLDIYLKALSKRKPTADDKGKTMPVEALGTCMVSQACLLGEEMPYGRALLKAGQAHEKIATCQGDFVNNARVGYYANLDRSLTDMKDFANLRKKLENRRLDLDAKLNKLQKAKKEKPELEEDLRVAQVKYDDTLCDVRARMVIIAEADEYHVRDLTLFIESELSYYQKTVEILTPVLASLKEICATPKPKRYLSSDIANSTGTASVGRSLTHSESRRRKDSGGEVPSSLSGGSFDEFEVRPSPLRQQTGSSINSDRQAPAPPIPRRNSKPLQCSMLTQLAPKKRVRCLYDFDPADQDELTMAVGDIITVTKEIDEGWWVGEIGSGPHKRSGMFPVNYTELVKETPSRSSGDSEAWIISGNSGPTFADPEEAHDESPRPSFRRTSTASSGTSSNQVTPNHSFSGPPQSNGVTFRESAPARPSGPKPGTVAPSSRSKPPNRTSYMRPPGEAAANMAAAVEEATNPTVSAATCRECGCDDFSANVFKKGSCNNCFHAH